MNLPNSPVILDLVLKSTALLLLAFALQNFRRRASAAQRGFIWLAVFAVLALLPLTLFVTPRVALDWLPPTKAITTVASLPEIKMSTVGSPVVAAMPPDVARPARRISMSEFAAAVWLVGAALVLAHRMVAAHWFNPLVWLAARSWRVSQEQACDDLVLRAGADAEGYAMQLLDAARSRGASGLLPSPALAMAKPSTLETRLSAIVDASRDRRPLSRAVRVSGMMSGLLLLALCAAMQLRAADKPAAKPGNARKPGEMAAHLIIAGVAQAHPEWQSEVDVRLQKIDDDLGRLDWKEASGTAEAPATPKNQTAAAKPDAKWAPEDQYFKGYLAVQKAERLEREGDAAGACQALLEAREIIEGISRKFPGWQIEIVRFRLKKINETIQRLGGNTEVPGIRPENYIAN